MPQIKGLKTKIALGAAVLMFGLFIGAYIAFATGVPSIDELKKHDTTAGTRIYADDDGLIGEIKLHKGIHVPLDQIPDSLKKAVVAVEDSRFWDHSGIDYVGIGRALFKDILHMSLREGGSTITQQLAKNVFLTPERTISRKIREAQLALRIEKELSKKEILELYLNRIYLGHGAYGVEMAARTYFGKSVRNLNLAESAMIAGLLKAPTTYSPFNDLVRAKTRQEIVLARMVEEQYIKQAQADAAKKQPLALSQTRAASEANNYFVEYIRQQLVQKYGEEKVYKGGLRVYTTLDKNAQLQAQRALQEGLRDVDKRRGWRGPIGHKEVKDQNSEPSTAFTATAGEISTGVVMSATAKEAMIKSRGLTGKLTLAEAQWAATYLDKASGKPKVRKNFKLTDILKQGDIVWVRFKAISAKNITFGLEQEPEVEGAVVAVDPSTGFVRAMVGGFSYTKSEFNRAVLAQRQPGSAFKPIIYAAALQNGYTPASVVVDEPVSYPGGPTGSDEWKPENYDRTFMGPTRLRDGLAYSRNVITVKLVDSIGVDKVIGLARQLGIHSDMPRNLSISLGSVSVTPLELTTAFASFANNGVRMRPVTVKYITDAKGEILENVAMEATPVLSGADAFLITSMMEDVIRHGTGMRAAIGRPAAGKTGTSNDYKDAWFVGYTPNLAAGVWVGFDDMRKSLGGGEVGGRAAAPIWARFMRSAQSDETAQGFAMPEGVERTLIDPASGLLADSGQIDAVYEYFKAGTAPKEHGGRGSTLLEWLRGGSAAKPQGTTAPKKEIDPLQD